MEPESSFPYSQAPATCPCPEPTPSSLHNPFPLPEDVLILSSHLCLGLPSRLFPSGFPTKTLCTPLPSSICATCPAHLILLDFINRTILGEEYRSLSSSLCNFLHSPVTPSLLSPNNLLNTLFSNSLSLCSSLYVNDQVSHTTGSYHDGQTKLANQTLHRLHTTRHGRTDKSKTPTVENIYTYKHTSNTTFCKCIHIKWYFSGY